MRKIKTLLLKPWFVALILTAIVIAFLPNVFNKYKVEVIDSGTLEQNNNAHVQCHDLNNDGYSEKIISYEYDGKHSIQVITHDGGIVDQWNMGGIIAGRGQRFVCGNYDNDEFDEVYAFYQRNDSVLLECFEPMDTISPIWYTNKLVCVLSSQYAEPDYVIIKMLIEDINGDGKEELFFVINSGKSKIPRGLIIYDISKDSIINSKNYGSTLNYGVTLCDINEDGKIEFCGNTTAAGQIADSLGFNYNDYSAWLMVFNHKLELIFNPIEFPRFRPIVTTLPVSINGTNLFACFYNHRGPLDNYPRLILVNDKGDIVKEHQFPLSSKIQRWMNIVTKGGNTYFYIIEKSGLISVYNQEFELVDKIKLDYSIERNYVKADLDLDGEDEFIFATVNRGILITRNDFSNSAFYSLDFLPGALDILIENGDNKPYLYIYKGEVFSTIQYGKNLLYPLRFLIYLGIFIAIWLFILFIRKLQFIQIQKRERIRSQIVNLQLKSYRNQMDPHFTFNVFNTMAYKIQKESPESYEAFMEFSNLIRKTLISSDSITRTINDEISHLRSYLELEKLRFPDKVFYSIEVEKEVNLDTHIPKLIL